MKKRVLRAAAATALAAGAVLVGGSAASGQDEQVAEFAYTGEAASFTVPADVCSITVDAYGAAGNAGDIIDEQVAFGREPTGGEFAVAPGGLGGRATATVAVTPGEELGVYVGGQGFVTDGGFNGGGEGGGADEDPGGGGGGASDVRRGAGLEGRLVVAGGGGGGGAEGEGSGGDGGGDTGLPGAPSESEGSPGGLGGSQSGGGAAPTGFDPTATDGALGVGGSGGVGTDENDGGGGGGGGYYGGGGGAGDDEETDDGGGGGGGSGFGPAGVTFETGVNEGDGFVAITWTVDPGCGDEDTTTTTGAIAADSGVRPRFTG